MMQRWVKVLILSAILADLLIPSAVMISYADLNKKYQGTLAYFIEKTEETCFIFCEELNATICNIEAGCLRDGAKNLSKAMGDFIDLYEYINCCSVAFDDYARLKESIPWWETLKFLDLVEDSLRDGKTLTAKEMAILNEVYASFNELQNSSMGKVVLNLAGLEGCFEQLRGMLSEYFNTTCS